MSSFSSDYLLHKIYYGDKNLDKKTFSKNIFRNDVETQVRKKVTFPPIYLNQSCDPPPNKIKYDSYIHKIMDEIKYQNNNEVLRKFPNLSKSVDERGKFQSGSESLFKNDYPNFMRKYENYEKQEDINTKINENMGNLLHSSDKFIQSHIRKSPDKINEIKGINSNFINKNKKDEVNELFSHNEKNKEDLDALLRSSDRFNQSFRTKSPHRMNEVKGRNYNYVNKNKKDEVKALLFIDKTYNKPVERVYEDIDNPLKINKKDYIEMISNPKVSIYNLNKNKNDISNYEILKKKFVNYIHFNIHKESIDDKIIEKANKIRECEEKKFLMSKIINDIKLREKYNSALEKRIIASFDETRKARLIQLLNYEHYFK